MKPIAPEYVFNFYGIQIISFCATDVDDGLQLHDHPFDHLALAITGAPEVFYADGARQVLRPGDPPLKFMARQQHGIRATARGDRFINIMPYPMSR